MTATWESHEAEEQLEIIAPSPEAVVSEAVGAFSRLVGRGGGGDRAQHVVFAEGSDRAGMLVELLQELIFLADTDGFVADECEAAFEHDRLRVVLLGRNTAVDPIVKAATYHDLRFEQRADGWHARVVLDV